MCHYDIHSLIVFFCFFKLKIHDPTDKTLYLDQRTSGEFVYSHIRVKNRKSSYINWPSDNSFTIYHAIANSYIAYSRTEESARAKLLDTIRYRYFQNECETYSCPIF